MPDTVLAPILVACLFYGVLPLIGAWRARRSWSLFREAAQRAAGSRDVDFSLLHSAGPPPEEGVRLTGTLEAFEGRESLWVGNEDVSVAVSLRGTAVSFLDEQEDPFAAGTEPPRKAEAASLGALPEGTQFLIWGSLVRGKGGRVQFASTPDRPLLVLAFEGDPATVLARAVYAGRPRIDHWNSWTPVSLAFGFLSLIILAYLDLRPSEDRTVGLVALALALLPSTFFLPPGILLFFGFARFWALARDQRARVDLAAVHGPVHPGDEQLLLKARSWEFGAHALLLAGVVSNAMILVWAAGQLTPR